MQDVYDENKSFWSRNYFFLGSLIVIIVNVVLFLLIGDKLEYNPHIVIDDSYRFDRITFKPLTDFALNAFSLYSLKGLLIDGLLFLVASTYIERKTGSLKLILLTFTVFFFSAIAIGADSRGQGGVIGFSGLYAYALFDFLFSLKDKNANRSLIIHGALVAAFIVVYFHTSVTNGRLLLFWYPHSLVYGIPNYVGFIVGTILYLSIKLSEVNWRKNFFFIGTLLFIVSNIVIYICCGNSLSNFITFDHIVHWGDFLYFKPIVKIFLDSLAHNGLEHLILNMVRFLIVGLYLEPKIGTLRFVPLVLAMTLFASCGIFANRLFNFGYGFSGILYGLEFFILVDYVFSIKNARENLPHFLLNSLLVVVILFSMFLCGDSQYKIKPYPYDLITNIAHYTGALVGLIYGLTIKIIPQRLFPPYNENSASLVRSGKKL